MPDEADPLWLMSRDLRDKLDRIAVKLHLREWQGLTRTQRQTLDELPCATAEEVASFATRLREILGYEPEPLTRKPRADGGTTP